MTDGRLPGSYGMETLRRLKLQQQGPRITPLPPPEKVLRTPDLRHNL
jgi:hypothetical protein